MKYKITIFVFLSLTFLLSAQNNAPQSGQGGLSVVASKVVKGENVLGNHLDSNRYQEDSIYYCRTIDSLKRVIAQNQDSVKLLKSDCAKLEMELSTCHGSLSKVDSLKITHADTLTIRVMRNRLSSKYVKKNVDDAIADYVMLSNMEMKKYYERLSHLLSVYETYFDEIRKCVKELQDDPRRIIIFKTAEYKTYANQRLHNLPYYKQYYTKKGKIDESIPYLDNIIEQIQYEINEHGTHQKGAPQDHIASFTYILNQL